MDPSPRYLVTETTFRVRYAETDMMGVVHHAAYLIWLEEGRSELSRQHGAPYAELETMGYSLAVSDVRVRYIAPARYDELVTVRTWVQAIRSREITFGYEVLNARTGQTLATGHSRHICVDRRGQGCRIPAGWASVLKQAAGL